MLLNNCNIINLLNKIKNEHMQLIYFGAGKQLTEACGFFSEFSFFDYIYRIIDNNPKTFTWQGKSKEAILPSDILNNINPEQIIIYITPTQCLEIYEQLDKMPHLSSVECYIHNFVVHMPLPYKFEECQSSEKKLIPKVIHYCWFGGNEMPEQYNIWMESWQKHCPDYTIVRWDEKNYDISKNQYMYTAYKNKKYAFVADYARLDIIYEHGGTYFDTDVEIIKNIDDLLYNQCFMGFSGPGVLNTGLGFGSVKRFPLIKEMRDHYNDYEFINDDSHLEIWNNGKHQSMVAQKYGVKPLNKPQSICGAVLLPTDVLCPFNWLRNPIAFTDNTYAVHHFNSSWYDVELLSKRNWQYSSSDAMFKKLIEKAEKNV